MKKTTMNIKKMVAMILTAAMAISVVTLIQTTDEVQAADLSFESEGTSRVTLAGSPEGPEYFIKFKAKTTGTVKLRFSGYGVRGEVQLLNSKKKAIATKESWTSSGDGVIDPERTYGIKKGTTYYFWVKNYSSGSSYPTTVAATVNTVKKYNCTSKKKAKSLKKDEELNSILIAGEKTSDWYKVKVAKDTYVSFTVKALTNGGRTRNSKFLFTFYDTNGKVVPLNYHYISQVAREMEYVFYVPKGTCYIKVEPVTQGTSGSYSITWTR